MPEATAVSNRSPPSTGWILTADSIGRARHLVLQQDEVRVVVDPNCGGAVREFSWRGQSIFRATAAASGDNPFDQACFPMVPFCNRIANGEFEFAGRVVHLPRNWDGDAHTIHGEGWRRPWSVVETSDRNVHLAFLGGGANWPWPYRAEQRFEVDAKGLSIELSAVNVGREVMPLMLGLHPYFSTDRRSGFRAHLPRYWQMDDSTIPTMEVDTPPHWGFESPLAEGLPIVDHCFSGWNGMATLFRSDCVVGVRATGCPWLHLYRPLNYEFLCIEPQSSATGALNRGGAEVKTLRPGERSAISLRVAVEGC